MPASRDPSPRRDPAPIRAPGAALLILALLLAGWVSLPSAAEKVVVVLKDGQRIEGVEVQRLGDMVEIQLKTGDLMAIPASLVQNIEVTAQAPPEPPPPISGPPLPPPKEGDARPRNISGPDLKPPTASEQLAVFGSPPPPQRPIIDPTWQPTNAFPEWTKPEMQPVEWSKPVIDPTWTPTSAYDPNADVLAAGRHEWSKPSIDPTWQPTDAFAR